MSWLIQSRLACFPRWKKKTLLKDGYLTVTMAAAILSTKVGGGRGLQPPPPLPPARLPQPGHLFLALEFA